MKAEAELQSTEAELEAAKQRFAELARYVNGAANAAIADPQALFAVLATIVADLDAVHAENFAAADKVPHMPLASCLKPSMVAIPAWGPLLSGAGFPRHPELQTSMRSPDA